MAKFYHLHMTQRVSTDPNWAVNCTAYCGAMMINDAALGGVDVNGRLVRAYSDEPVPQKGSPGLNLSQVINVAWDKFRVRLEDRTGDPWNQLVKSVRSGRRALLQIDYAELGRLRCQANGDFGHAVVITNMGRSDLSLRASDPLCDDTKVYPSEVMQAAARKFARDTGVNEGLRWAESRIVPLISY